MQILRRASFKAVPWKNGGGITHEALRVPAICDPFRWRVSVADLAVSGPFSHFAGYRRTMVLLRGAGVRLTFDGGEPRILHAVGDLVEFDGACATSSELLDGGCVDLNLMVSTSLPAAHARVERLRAPHELFVGNGTTLVFPIQGRVSITTTHRETVLLEAWDLAIIAPADAVWLSPGPADDAMGSLVFFATLEDNLA